MSMDYYVYLKGADAFSPQDFEHYASSLRWQIKLHPSFSLAEDAGFSPICLTDGRFAAKDGACSFLSGFELYASEYRHVCEPPKKAKGFFGRLFSQKPAKESPFDRAVKEASLLICLSCSSGDSFEVLLAYLFGAYLVKNCGGVFDDPQSGRFYDVFSHLENELAVIEEELLEQYENGELLTHEFKEWL